MGPYGGNNGTSDLAVDSFILWLSPPNLFIHFMCDTLLIYSKFSRTGMVYGLVIPCDLNGCVFDVVVTLVLDPLGHVFLRHIDSLSIS